MTDSKLVVWFKDVDKEDVGLVGGKGANLGEMVRAGFPVPNGFIVTAPAYFNFLAYNKLQDKIKSILEGINYKDTESLDNSARQIQRLITRGRVPKELVSQIFKFYKSLGGVLHNALVAVRSSATAEDLPTASFAGQQETYLNIKGEANLVEAIRRGWASLFTPRAIFYRHENKFDHMKVGIAIAVQKMVESEISGVAFTVDPVTNDRNKIVIEAIYGLGELIVQGSVNPDHYEVSKKSKEIIDVNLNSQKVMLVKRGHENKNVKVTKKLIEKQKLTDSEIKKLAQLCLEIERHYFFPQDIEWAIEKGKIYIVQTRPITTIGKRVKGKGENIRELYPKSYTLTPILRGDPASPGLATGPVRIIKNPRELNRVGHGDILVAPKTNPDYVTAMKRAAGIVAETGGRTSHAAIVSRELGIPAIVGAKNAIITLKDDMIITINGSTGEIFKGIGYRGQGSKKVTPKPSTLPPLKTATRLYVNLSEPSLAPKIAQMDVDGVGLLRAEFMLAKIGVHPKKLIAEGRERKFINQLTDGLRVFCESFSPRPVVYRASDFKTNEYKNLMGGKLYEPEEENPMLGYRGAFRYISDPKVFKLELESIKIVREELSLRNLILMVPFVRSVSELNVISKIINQFSWASDLKIWMMIEVPVNVILIEQFLKTDISGISIGSNDLTMLILGADRDNSEVKPLFDERSPALLWAMERVIRAAQRAGKTSSICGEAPTTHPEIIEKLVSWGITSISVEPDAIGEARETIAQSEKKLFTKIHYEQN